MEVEVLCDKDSILTTDGGLMISNKRSLELLSGLEIFPLCYLDPRTNIYLHKPLNFRWCLNSYSSLTRARTFVHDGHHQTCICESAFRPKTL